MENKEAYTPGEVKELILLYTDLDRQSRFIFGNYQSSVYSYDKKVAKSTAMDMLEELPRYEKIPENIREGMGIESKVNGIKDACKKILLE